MVCGYQLMGDEAHRPKIPQQLIQLDQLLSAVTVDEYLLILACRLFCQLAHQLQTIYRISTSQDIEIDPCHYQSS